MPGIISRFAGSLDSSGIPVYGYSGDAGPATSAKLYNPVYVAVDSSNNLYIADHYNNVIRKIDSSGIITTVAGNGSPGFSGDGGSATSAELSAPNGVAVDSSNNLYIADENGLIRKIDSSGIITRFAGSLDSSGIPVLGFSGDGGPATSAELSAPYGVAVDFSNNLYFSDGNTGRVRKIDSSGIITTVAGIGGRGPYSGDGSLAINARLSGPTGIAVDSSGNIYIAEGDNVIRKIDSSGIITRFAGSVDSSGIPVQGYSGDGGPATSATLNVPFDIALDYLNNIYISDSGNNVIRKIDSSGIITTVAGNGSSGFSGDGGSATSAEFNFLHGVVLDSLGNIYIADSNINLIRKVISTPDPPSAPILVGSATSTIITVRGNTAVRGVTGAVFFLLDASGNHTGNGFQWDASANAIASSHGGNYIIDSSGNDIDALDPSGNRFYAIEGSPDASGNYTATFHDLIPGKTYKVSWALTNVVGIGAESSPSVSITTSATPPVTIPFADNIYPGVAYTNANGTQYGILYELNGTQPGGTYNMTIDGTGPLDPNKVVVWAVGGGGGGSINLTSGGGGGAVIVNYDFGYYLGAGVYSIGVGEFVTGVAGNGTFNGSSSSEVTAAHNGNDTFIANDLVGNCIAVGGGGKPSSPGNYPTASNLYIGGNGGGDSGIIAGGGPLAGSDASSNYMNVFGNFSSTAGGVGAGPGVQFTSLALPTGSDLVDSSGNSLYFGKGGSVGSGNATTFGEGGGNTSIGNMAGNGFNGLVLVWVSVPVPSQPAAPTKTSSTSGTITVKGNITGVTGGPFNSVKFYIATGSGSFVYDNYGSNSVDASGNYSHTFEMLDTVNTTYNIKWSLVNSGGESAQSPVLNVPAEGGGNALCFLHGSRILCLNEGLKEEYIAVEDMRVGTPVKTLKGTYVKVHTIGKSTFNNPDNADRGPNRLFKLSPQSYPQLTEDLIVTGCHSILVDKLEPKQKARHLQLMKELYMTTDKFRLMAFIDEKAEPYLSPGDHEIWHFALENDEVLCNYGVYANGGLLVETASIINMTERAGLVLIE